ncbi:unnamed protein product [[Candida] boidinii]|uniref:Unnamed protein product n=1 Tax=Candida boidinii TaxID=5477 RepID=A0ACB5TRG5_CANBO|nr:unnamed protein product [[Candida] boidinii]GMF01838.1 unnamed protein product [[Candida] boidinii]
MTEKEAQEVVSEARQYRAQKLKAAKTDASAEVDAYKAKKDAELKKFEETVSFKFILIYSNLFSGNNKQLEDDAEKSVVEELAKIKKTCEAKKSDVINLLVKAVTEPKPALHANVSV